MFNIPKLQATHRRALADHKAAEQEALRIAGAHAEEHVKNHSTFKRQSVNSLKDNTRSRIVRSRGGALLRLSWTKPYAGFVEAGTRVHGIRARRAPALVFFWKKTGRVMFLKSVRHPGTRPYKFGWRATHSAHRVLGERLTMGMARVSRRFH